MIATRRIIFGVFLLLWLDAGFSFAHSRCLSKSSLGSSVASVTLSQHGNDDRTESEGDFFLTYRGGNVWKNSHSLTKVQRLYQSYLAALEQRPLITKGLTAAIVNFLGDILAQYLEASTAKEPLTLDWKRLYGFFWCGLLYIGPYVHTWYEQLWKLGTWLERRFASSKQAQTMAQVLLDQTVGVAIFFSTYFYLYELIDAVVNLRGECVKSVETICSLTLARIRAHNSVICPWRSLPHWKTHTQSLSCPQQVPK